MLVIITLIVGSIIGGQSFIHSAKLGRVIQQLNAFDAAHSNFIFQYNGLAGDLDNAATYWPGEATNGNCDRHLLHTVTAHEESLGY